MSYDRLSGWTTSALLHAVALLVLGLILVLRLEPEDEIVIVHAPRRPPMI